MRCSLLVTSKKKWTFCHFWVHFTGKNGTPNYFVIGVRAGGMQCENHEFCTKFWGKCRNFCAELKIPFSDARIDFSFARLLISMDFYRSSDLLALVMAPTRNVMRLLGHDM